MIRLEAVQRQFGPQILFRDLSWRILRGARLGLVGPNGTGKTTLLRMLSGRESPDAGKIHKGRELRIAYLPQEVETVEGGSVLSVVLGGMAEAIRISSELERSAGLLAELEAGSQEAERETQRYGALRQRFEALDGDRMEARAKAMLAGLGVPASRFDGPIEELSGGWRMRVVLAKLLLGEPDLLLLDEPTNHLDLEAIGWLENFLENFEGAFVVVSHDRYFLNRMARNIVDLDGGVLTEYSGNYDAYVEAKALRSEQLEHAAKQQAKVRAQTERFIERFRYKNTKSRQVQSRIKALNKTETVETQAAQQTIRFGFPPAPRSGDIVVRAEGVTKRFGETVVYRDLNLLLRRGDRLALTGPNGAGKSTLLKMLAGHLDPDGGKLELGHKVQMHHYAQHQLEALNPERTVLEEMEQNVEPGLRQRLRNTLGSFLFRGADVDKRVAVLSGGEKARLALAKMLIEPSNLLLLDEPTNHLDLRSREVLEEALNDYAGSLVVISHDRYFINRVVTRIGHVGNGRLELYEGDYDTYLAHLARLEAEQGKPEAEVPGEGAGPGRRAGKRQEAEERNRLYRERRAVQKKLEPLEQAIHDLETRLSDLDVQHADPQVYSDPEKAREVGRQRGEAAAELDDLYKRWELLAAELNES